ncbi:unnamed protein product [Choristocarpus tenellus]
MCCEDVCKHLMDFLLAVLGVIGLAESIAEFVWVMLNLDKLEDFNRLFFVLTSSCEMAGLLVSFFVCCTVGLVELRASFFLADPIHNTRAALLKPLEESNQAPIGAVEAASIGLMISVIPSVVWASFYPVWGGDFEEDDDRRILLCTASCIVMIVALISGCCRGFHLNGDCLGWLTCFTAWYVLQKVFEAVYLTNDDEYRESQSILWWVLVVSLYTEVFSALWVSLFLLRVSVCGGG